MSGKKSKAPVQLDIGNVLATLEKKQQSQKNRQDAKSVILSGGFWLLMASEYALFRKKVHSWDIFLQLGEDYLLFKSNFLSKRNYPGRRTKLPIILWTPPALWLRKASRERCPKLRNPLLLKKWATFKPGSNSFALTGVRIRIKSKCIWSSGHIERKRGEKTKTFAGRERTAAWTGVSAWWRSCTGRTAQRLRWDLQAYTSAECWS